VDRMFLWDHSPGGNVEHISEHDLTPEEVESAFDNVEAETTSRSTGRPAIFGRTHHGEVVFVVFEIDRDEDGKEFIYVHTAYEAEEDS
jgi:uncharacterized DUF497 family protein